MSYKLLQYHTGLSAWCRIMRSDTQENLRRMAETEFSNIQWVERPDYIEAMDSQGKPLGFRIKQEETE